MFPNASQDAGINGVGVASVLVGFDGRIERVDVLEVPDAEIARAMEEALYRWVFLPFETSGDRVPLRVQSKVTFYFSGGEVLRPDEMLVAMGRVAPTSFVYPRFATEIEESDLEALAGVLLEIQLIELTELGDGPREVGRRSGSVGLSSTEPLAWPATGLIPGQYTVLDCADVSSVTCAEGLQTLESLAFSMVAFLPPEPARGAAR